MKRQTYSVSITDNTGAVLADDQRYAMNAGIRASEALVREIARSEGAIYHGDTPQRVGDVYTRGWTSISGITVTARCWGDHALRCTRGAITIRAKVYTPTRHPHHQ